MGSWGRTRTATRTLENFGGESIGSEKKRVGWNFIMEKCIKKNLKNFDFFSGKKKNYWNEIFKFCFSK